MPSRDLSWLHEAPNGNPFVLLPSRANVAFQNVAVKTKEDTIFQRRSMTRHFRTDSTSLVNGWSGSLSVHLHEIPRLQRCLPCNASCHGGLLFKKKNTRPEQYPFYGRVRQQQKNWKKTNSSSWWSPKNKTKMAPHLHTHLHNGENKNVLAVDKKKGKNKRKKNNTWNRFFFLAQVHFPAVFSASINPKKRRKCLHYAVERR